MRYLLYLFERLGMFGVSIVFFRLGVALLQVCDKASCLCYMRVILQFFGISPGFLRYKERGIIIVYGFVFAMFL